jgi:putative ABC transport system ATP-binding protein
MIEVADVRKVYETGANGVEALAGVTFQVKSGGFAFIVGPSGSGKTTLLTLLGALDRPTSGTICVEGQDLGIMSEDEQDAFRREKVGFVFQSFNLIGNLSAIDNVLVPFLPWGHLGDWPREAAELLTRVGLGKRLDHRPSQLSGGEQQRVAIARALIKNPILILADEPTGELDSRAGEEIFQILRQQHTEGRCTVIVVTHDRRFITPADLVLELEDGRLVDGAGH